MAIKTVRLFFHIFILTFNFIVIVNSSAFFLFLSPEFLGQLASFFVVPEAPVSVSIAPELVANKTYAEQQAALNATTSHTNVNIKPKTRVRTPDAVAPGGGAGRGSGTDSGHGDGGGGRAGVVSVDRGMS